MASSVRPQDPSAHDALLRTLRDGSWAEAAGVSRQDVQALARVGASALLSGRVPLACTVFEGLVALEPRAPEHRLHLAAARRAAGDDTGALEQIEALLMLEPLDDGSAVHALLLRAEICGVRDRPRAKADLVRAKELAARSAAGRAAWEQSA